jgi:hypothetical protein
MLLADQFADAVPAGSRVMMEVFSYRPDPGSFPVEVVDCLDSAVVIVCILAEEVVNVYTCL